MRRYPDWLAVKTRSHQLTYDELNKAANRIARVILDQSGEGPEPVVLLFDQGLQEIAAMLGTLKAGKFFVLVSPSFPRARISQILEDSQSSLIVTDNQNLTLATELISEGTQLLNTDRIEASVSAENLNLPIPPDAISYLIYTSGSTGRPKAVVQSHQNVLYAMRNRANRFHTCPEDRWSLFSSGTAQAIINSFSALLNGAALYPFDIRGEGVGHLADWLIRERITMIFISLALYRHFMDTLTGEEEFPGNN